eukprot:jgi/Pico_ML_1/51037/g2141.t1
MNPLAKKKEITISQMTSLENAPKASAKLRNRCRANPTAMDAIMGTIFAPSHDSIHPFFASFTLAAATVGIDADPE